MRIHLTAALAALAAVGAAQEARPAVFDASAFEPIFDGRTLEGWVTKGGRYDGNAAWSVEGGAICGREGPNHAGGLLYTARRYACFILSLEVWMTRPNDSGIFIRMAPEGRGAQVTLDDRDDGEIGAVYADEFLAHNTTARAKWRAGVWNRVEVRCTGADMRIEAWVNGDRITDHQIPPGTPGFAPTGLIGVQVHGNRDDSPRTVVKFRDLRIRELPVFDNADFTADDAGIMKPTEAGAKKGWTLLYDGLSDVRSNHAWSNRGFFFDPLSSRLYMEGGVLSTLEHFRDFELHLDFSLRSKGANSGVFLRADAADVNPAFSGCEIQILDDYNWEKMHGGSLEPWQLTGSIYGSSPPRVAGMLAPDGNWNSYRIVYQGSRLRVELNGVIVQDVDVSTLPVPSAEKPFAERRKAGFIGLQRHGASWDDVRFRNIFVRRLP
jgi:hypothetical protein